MLSELRVKNLGIIEDMTWRLREGLNLITGETGAGKSLVIDAVELLLSARADEDVIRYGADEAEIEGLFTLPQNKNLRSLRDLLKEKDLSADEETLVINCRLRKKGPVIIRVNGQPVPRTLLQQIGRILVDIHGQSEHLSLLDTRRHLDFLDSYAHTLDLRNDFSIKVAELLKTEQELKSLEKVETERARQGEFLRFQINEINKAQLRDGEEEELERERNLLSSTEKLKSLAYDVYRALYEDDSSTRSAPALNSLNEALTSMKKLAELDQTLSQELKLLDEATANLSEIARDIHAYGDRLHYDPDRLEEIESRLELLKSLKRKYGQTIAEILDYRTKAEKELDSVEHSAEKRAQLERLCVSLKQEMGQMAHRLSEERSKAAKRLVTEVKKELDDLNMSQVVFEVSLCRKPDPAGIPFSDSQLYAFNEKGADNVEFMVSTNPGEPIKPLARIASTGEISRFTLALKGALSETDSIPVLIFDEIDIGIGGRSGEIIGKKLWALGRDRQVICITHLPQIAAFADAHFSIHKETYGSRTLSVLEELDGDSRVRELAAMLAGSRHSEASLNIARELMRKAKTWEDKQKKEKQR